MGMVSHGGAGSLGMVSHGGAGSRSVCAVRRGQAAPRRTRSASCVPVASLAVASLAVASLAVASLPVASLPVASLPVACIFARCMLHFSPLPVASLPVACCMLHFCALQVAPGGSDAHRKVHQGRSATAHPRDDPQTIASFPSQLSTNDPWAQSRRRCGRRGESNPGRRCGRRGEPGPVADVGGGARPVPA